MEIEQLHSQMREMASQHAQTIQLLDYHWQSKFASQQERMLQQQQEKDAKMHSIIERLVGSFFNLGIVNE